MKVIVEIDDKDWQTMKQWEQFEDYPSIVIQEDVYEPDRVPAIIIGLAE